MRKIKGSWRAEFADTTRQPDSAEYRGESHDLLDRYIVAPVHGVPVLDLGITRLDLLASIAIVLGIVIGAYVFCAGFDGCAAKLGW